MAVISESELSATCALAPVIDFDEQSSMYGEVIKTVPLPPPGNIGNEPHHCHLNSNRTILGCGGLLSLLKGQNWAEESPRSSLGSDPGARRCREG
jgi:hypothetical protein